MTVERTSSALNPARQKIINLITVGIISSNVILFAVLYFVKMPFIDSIPVATAGAAIVSIIELACIRTAIAKRSRDT
jgi:hypothetical protein